MMHRAGDEIEFVAQRPCWLRYRHYEAGDIVRIRLVQDWNDTEGLGEGGPWGRGGYTSRRLARIGTLVEG